MDSLYAQFRVLNLNPTMLLSVLNGSVNSMAFQVLIVLFLFQWSRLGIFIAICEVT